MAASALSRPHDASVTVVRAHIRVRGVVQGVGFRPFVYREAQQLGLCGWVRNDAEGVAIEAEGDAARVAQLVERLAVCAPPLARVDAVEREDCTPYLEQSGFHILESGAGRLVTAIGHDSAVCRDCLAELFDPGDRRWRYAFINCTHCGPRYTITRSLPYDRAQTSMAGFVQCAACESEYRDPAHRRFHAEPNACPDCGPRLELREASGAPLEVQDPIAEVLARLRRGEILAIKGLGGFHLACDATDARAVARLRARKQREEKPFALMFANGVSAACWAHYGADERVLLDGGERPIVLLRKRAGTDEAFPGVAPGIAWLGAMLPYTPLQYLLFHEAAGRPAGLDWLDQPQSLALVMTSANPNGEPLVRDNDEALARLAGIADAFLLHDRDIVVRCDDSVVRSEEAGAGAAALGTPRYGFIRRARGYTPRAIKLARSGPSVLALGGWFKNTVCLTRGDEAFVSQHVGDLDNATTCTFLDETVAHLERILDVRPALIAHDLHPDFHSSRLAAELGARRGVPALAVQHHHAHIAAVLAEHRHDGPVLGLALDGVGLGSDGTAWGGELLRVDGVRCQRLGHLRELPLPGGDRAAREPWRMAAAALHALGQGDAIGERFAHQPAASTVTTMLARGINCPPTSSMGRWFDAAAGLLGVREVMAFEGQAAMLLEGLAEKHGEIAPDLDAFVLGADGTLDLLPLLARLAAESDAARGAALFHATLAAALEAWVLEGARRADMGVVALGGGCFLNHLLSRSLRCRLAAQGIDVLEARQLPPNDGGLSLGQAWVAQRTLD